MTKENQALTFHNENSIARISMWATIIAYTILVLTAFDFLYNVYNIIANWAQIAPGLPTNALERIQIFVSNLFLPTMPGVFYFLALRGISQLLNLGLDIYYGKLEDEEV